jgi:hypothetical protein
MYALFSTVWFWGQADVKAGLYTSSGHKKREGGGGGAVRI